MTVANWLTIFRLVLIPVFVLFAIYYGQSVKAGAPERWLHMAAVAAFIIASLTDAIDGWVARRFNQHSRLGVILDPLADKALLLTAIFTLCFAGWEYTLPLWFVVVVVTRDVAILGGCAVLKMITGNLDVKPNWLGKTSTALQMVALSWVMLQIPHPMYAIYAAGAMTAVSGFAYLIDAMRQLGEHSRPMETK